MEVSVFIPCFIDQLYADTAFNVIKVLKKCGCKVKYNPEQTCCGQPSFNSGHWGETRSVALKFLNDFGGDSLIVSPSASCSGFIRNHYSRLFNDEEDKQKAIALKSRIYEFTDFLINKLGVEDLGAVFPHRVTYHDGCSALREYGIKEEPRRLLKQVSGLDLVEMEETETCCGFGGSFSAKFTDISTAMTEQKVGHALATSAEYIVSTEASCLMNIESYIRKQKLPLKTIHIADVLASGY